MADLRNEVDGGPVDIVVLNVDVVITTEKVGLYNLKLLSSRDHRKMSTCSQISYNCETMVTCYASSNPHQNILMFTNKCSFTNIFNTHIYHNLKYNLNDIIGMNI